VTAAPSTDPRRAKALGEALARMAPWLAPDWAGPGTAGDFGAALYEIAARLAEQSTRRLDQTPLRDKLAFLDTLDIAAPAPRSASVPIVFRLAEKRTEPVYAPPRVQIAAPGDPQPVIFETVEAIAISPARPLLLLAADPAADHIEIAPSEVTAAPTASPPPIAYRLVSAAEPGATMLQLAQSVGLAPGDLVKIAGKTYRLAKLVGEIASLLDPLEESAPAGAPVEKVTRLDSFALRNLTRHLAYVGHKSLLKLDGRAAISLRLDPPGLARRLTGLDIAYEIWGKSSASDAPGWQPLLPLGGSDGELRLVKDREGAVEEVEVEGRKSRWIRLRLLSPISDFDPPRTRALSVSMKVNSLAPPAGQKGSGSIVSAFYNGLPLPLTTAFLPFGPEPQRFDTFAVAAPEPLSKKGASVKLTVGLSDSSLGALAATRDAPERVYGIGRNGRLQSIRFDDSGVARWRQLERSAGGGGGGGASPRLDPAGGLYAFQGSAVPARTDIVVARDAAKALWIATLVADGDNVPVATWAKLAPPDGAAADSFCLVSTALQASPSPVAARLIAAGPDGLQGQAIDSAGAALGWQPLRPSPGAAPKAPLRIAPVTGGDDRIVAVDPDGALWSAGLTGTSVRWIRLAPEASVDPDVQPAAVLVDGETCVAAAGAADSPGPVVFAGESGRIALPGGTGAPAKPISIGMLRPQKGSGFPLVTALLPDGILLWWDEDQATVAALPGGGAASQSSLLLSPPGGSGGPRLVLGTPDEGLRHASIDAGERIVPFAASDALRLSSPVPPVRWWVDGEASAREIKGAPLRFGNDFLLPVPPGTWPTDRDYAPLAPGATGFGLSDPPPALRPRVRLDPGDTTTRTDDFLEIDRQLFRVTARKNGIVTLDRQPPPGENAYAAYRAGPDERIANADRGTLLNLAAALPEDSPRLGFFPPANPARQGFTLAAVQPPDGNWVKLKSGWKTAPTDLQLRYVVAASIGSWSKVPARSGENPELAWEYFDGRGWRRLDGAYQDGSFHDGTANLAASGTISFKVPDDLAPTEIAGKQDYWIRARLVGGDYGQASYKVDTVGTEQSIRVDRSGLNPPEIVTIEASYDLDSYAAPEAVLTVNNLAAVDQTQAAAAAGAEFDLFEGVAAHSGDPAGLGRALYLGLTRAPGVEALSLFVDARDVGAAPVRLRAEVLRAEGWAAILCDDGTAGLARPGLIRLFLSPEPAQLPLFGRDGWWLRLRALAPSADWAPVVRGLHLNAVAAEQARSLRQEIVGSSLGEPDQAYRLAESPVLPDTLELRVRESLSDEEKASLASADPEAVAAYGDIEGEWIRWRATDSFVAQGGGARVFRLDPSTGEIRFGDGRDGRIPPAGRDSIRAVAYQAGGGSRGNVAAFAVDQLKTALESVELAVNPVDSGGGADSPPEARLAETAPARLRHSGRALAAPDIEALATGSSPDVVQARCLRGRGCGIDLVVAIRQAGERCPIPSRARREGIARNIADCAWGALAPGSIRVRAPDYVPLKIGAVVLARAAEAVAQVEHDVRAALLAFLHSTDGGPAGLGWPFGRRPWPSDVQRVAAAVAGVDRVVDVSIAAAQTGVDLDRLGPATLVCVADSDIALDVQPPRSAR